MEEKMILNGECTVAILDRSTSQSRAVDEHLFYLSTKCNENFLSLGGWKQLLNCGSTGIKRYGVNCTKGALIKQLEQIFGRDNLVWPS